MSPPQRLTLIRQLQPAVVLLTTVLWVVSARPLGAETPTSSPSSRPLWTTSRVQGTPNPPDPYMLEDAFPGLSFDEPLAVSLIPGTNRFLLCERHGKLFTFEDSVDAKPKLLMDLGRTVYGAAAHPNFLNNGRLFVTSVAEVGVADGTHLSRFETSAEVSCWSWPGFRRGKRHDPDATRIVVEPTRLAPGRCPSESF